MKAAAVLRFDNDLLNFNYLRLFIFLIILIIQNLKAHQLLFFACYKEKPRERMEMEERKKRKAGGGGEKAPAEGDEDSGMEVW